MKTLDELIFEVPYTQTPWEADALSYLKEYRDNKEFLRYWTEKAISEQQNIIDGYMIQKDEDNPVLTWEQLKTMKGRPVWVEYESCNRKVWAIIDCFYTDAFQKVKMNVALPHDYWHLEKEMIGKTWQAYRKEREATGGNLVPEPKSKKLGDDTEIKWSENDVSRNND